MRLPVYSPDVAAAGWVPKGPPEREALGGLNPAGNGVSSVQWTVPTDERWYVERVSVGLSNLNAGRTWDAIVIENPAAGSSVANNVIGFAPLPARDFMITAVAFDLSSPFYLDPGDVLEVWLQLSAGAATTLNQTWTARMQRIVYKEGQQR